jgi:LAO/AO transport system kinase
VGKYFYRSFRETLNGLGKNVAVLAVDPSSTISMEASWEANRMEELVKDKNAFIRPSASGNIGWCGEKKQRINQPL